MLGRNSCRGIIAFIEQKDCPYSRWRCSMAVSIFSAGLAGGDIFGLHLMIFYCIYFTQLRHDITSYKHYKTYTVVLFMNDQT